VATELPDLIITANRSFIRINRGEIDVFIDFDLSHPNVPQTNNCPQLAILTQIPTPLPFYARHENAAMTSLIAENYSGFGGAAHSVVLFENGRLQVLGTQCPFLGGIMNTFFTPRGKLKRCFQRTQVPEAVFRWMADDAVQHPHGNHLRRKVVEIFGDYIAWMAAVAKAKARKRRAPEQADRLLEALRRGDTQ
jgi:hypothetical protein